MASISALNTVSLMGYDLSFPDWMCIGILFFVVFSLSGWFARLVIGFFKKPNIEEEV